VASVNWRNGFQSLTYLRPCGGQYLDKESAAKGHGRVAQEFALVLPVGNQEPVAPTPFSGMSINITTPSVFMVRTGH
jgi:hypothetical protein